MSPLDWIEWRDDHPKLAYGTDAYDALDPRDVDRYWNRGVSNPAPRAVELAAPLEEGGE